MQLQSRIEGAFLGLAVGDALGAPLEFLSLAVAQKRFGTLTEMVGNSIWAPGEWTDDTAMALGVARGIMAGANEGDEIEVTGEEFLNWSRTAKDVGSTISAVFRNLDSFDDWFDASRNTPQALRGEAAGNGSLMRILPVALAFSDREEMLRHSALHSAMTHFDSQAEVCCALYCLWVSRLLDGQEKCAAWYDALSDAQKLKHFDARTPGPKPLPSKFWSRMANIESLTLNQLQPSGYAGYVVECLEAAVWCVLNFDSFEETLVQIVNLAGEADTMGAVAGGAAGAIYGHDAIPERWLAPLHQRADLHQLARYLFMLREHLRSYGKPGLPPFSFDWLDSQLAAGRNPLTAHDVQVLKAAGITHVLDLRESHEWSPPHFGSEAVNAYGEVGITRLHLPIVDTKEPADADFQRAANWLEEVLRDPNAKIYAHCRAGMERTAAILCAIFAKRNQTSFEESLSILQRKRPIFAPLPGQIRAAKAWLSKS
ncbi:ADP-ribosyl-[dinitrogen reductase] glycohydrolase [Abditibacteriota bacterium]|nr:ADP-ribosyl-[dinitrogen reductase] glycohydrolase [Abditibacteriota bacterium]